MSFFGPNRKREAIIKGVAKWKDGTNAPMMDGKPVDLRTIVLHCVSDGGRAIRPWELRPDMDPVTLAEEMLDEMQQAADGAERSLEFRLVGGFCLADGTKAGQRELFHTSHPSVDMSLGAGAFATSDLRKSENREANLTATALHTMTRVNDSLVSTNRDLSEGYGHLLGRILDRLEKAEQRADRLQDRAEQVENGAVDRQIKIDKHNLVHALKRGVVDGFVLPALPGLGAMVQAKGAEWAGVDVKELPEELEDLAEFVTKDPAKFAALMDGLTESEKQRAVLLVQALQKKRETKLQKAKADAAMRGVARPLSLHQFKVIAGGKDTGTGTGGAAG